MINYKTKDKGMSYNYGDNTYYIEHGLFRLNSFKILDMDDRGNTFVQMSLQNNEYNVIVSPFYDEYIELHEGMVLKVAYIDVDYSTSKSIRVHGYEVSSDEEANKRLLEQLPSNTIDLKDQEVNVREVIGKIDSFIGLITDESIKKLVVNIYSKYSNELTVWPAAVSVHHNIKSGLLLHLCNVTRNAINIAMTYTDVSLSLVIAGSLLHDIGKIKEYTHDGKISEIGKYQDHISLGQIMIEREANGLLDERTLRRLLHIILSHHGRQEWGSAKVPSTKEAFIVHIADYIDTNMYIFHESYKKVSCGESVYNKVLGTYVVNDNIATSQKYDI